ncbi:MAG: hypothetical protein C4297_03865 [Gemmataceae bacterium]
MRAIVIVLPRCQLACLGPYGCEWISTPTLDRLATQSVVCDQHYADRATPNGVRQSWRFGTPFASVERCDWLCALGDAGVVTALITERTLLTDRHPFVRGWSIQEFVHEPSGKACSLRVLDAANYVLDRLVQREHWLLWLELPLLAFPWLEEDLALAPPEQRSASDSPVAIGDTPTPPARSQEAPADQSGEAKATSASQSAQDLHTEPEDLDVELWLDPPRGRLGQSLTDAEYDRLTATYGALIETADHLLGLLLDRLQALGVYDQSLLIVTSDLGLPLGEHDVIGASPPQLFEELVHVPLFLRLPGAAEAGRRIQQLTQPADMVPTLLEHFQLPVPESCAGKSLWPVLHGHPEKLREYACSVARMGCRQHEEWAIRTHHWYLRLPIWIQNKLDVRPELYKKPDDRWEVQNVADSHQDVAEHLELTLRRFLMLARIGAVDKLPELREAVLSLSQPA